LVTGPTGCGKTTTLAAIIHQINCDRRDHIITIEDPVEYVHYSKKGYVTQREVGAMADTLSFRNALKYALRQDPDVILIGEMRDYDTIGIAITSAETGHLVFGTLHTSSASQTVGRIIDVFPVDQQPQVMTQLSLNLMGILSQILLPRCDQVGRIACCEVMKSNSAIRNSIRSNKVDTIYQTIQTSSGEGMRTMDASLLELYKSNIITYETGFPYVRDEATRQQFKQLKATRPSTGSGTGPVGAHAAQEAPQQKNSSATATPTPAPEPEAQAATGPRRLGSMVIPPWEKKG
ncbi:MAG: type IV pilus twitching motility protein PilT, partial [bacterium]